MAYTITNRQIIPTGDKRMFLASITGATSGDVETGLNVVYHVELCATGSSDTTVYSSAISGGTVSLADTNAGAYTIKVIGH